MAGLAEGLFEVLRPRRPPPSWQGRRANVGNVTRGPRLCSWRRRRSRNKTSGFQQVPLSSRRGWGVQPRTRPEKAVSGTPPTLAKEILKPVGKQGGFQGGSRTPIKHPLQSAAHRASSDDSQPGALDNCQKVRASGKPQAPTSPANAVFIRRSCWSRSDHLLTS